MSAVPPLTVLSDDERLFKDSVYEFADREIRPLVREMDEQAKVPRSLVEKLFGLGVMGIEIPDAQGGSGATFFHAVLAVEALSRVDPSIGVLVDVQNTLVANALMRWGSDDVKARFLPRIASSVVGAYALSEAGSGSDAFALSTRATPVHSQNLGNPANLGNLENVDEWVLSGRKLWITNANEADIFIVFANANPAAHHHGITAFLVERGTAGFSVGRKEDKLGIRASSTCELLLDDCRVPARERAGRGRQGLQGGDRDTERRADRDRRADDRARHGERWTTRIGYIKERKQFGRSISEFQAVQHQVARAATELEAARLMVYNAARLRDAGRPFVTEAAMCKVFASEVAERVASLAVNLYGGYGFVKDYPVEKLFRDAKIGQIYEGTSNLQLQTIAKHILD